MLRTRAAGFVVSVVFAVGCGGGSSSSSTPDAAVGGKTAYRMTSLAIRDPQLWAASPEGGCESLLTIANGLIGTAIQSRSINILLVFEPIDTAGASTPLEVIQGDCESDTSCTVNSTSVSASFTATNKSSGSCVTFDSATLATDDPVAVASPSAPCFGTNAANTTIDLSGLTLNLAQTTVGATYGAGTVPTMLSNGLLFGFVSRTQAEEVTLPASLPGTLSDYLRDTTSCTDASGKNDRDVGPGSADGWFFYTSFAATKVTLTDKR